MDICGSLMDIFDQTQREAQTKTFMTTPFGVGLAHEIEWGLCFFSQK